MELDVNLEVFNIAPLSYSITEKALAGPTKDFEDNVQLHSSAEADCDYFLTEDKSILQIKFFGKVRIIDSKELALL